MSLTDDLRDPLFIWALNTVASVPWDHLNRTIRPLETLRALNKLDKELIESY